MPRYYADYLARNYARYYTSAAYRQALKYALPEGSAAREFQKLAKLAAQNRELGLSDAALTLITQFEGLRLEAYEDAGGKLTIGYGHLMRPSEAYTHLTPPQARALLRQDLDIAGAVVKSSVKVSLSPAQYGALVSLVYNIGAGAFSAALCCAS